MDFMIGGLAGAGATIITNPMDVVKTRMQLQGELRARTEHKARYKGIFHAMVVISRADGALALQRGLAPAMLLGFTMNSVRLGLYHVAEISDWTKSATGDIDIKKAVFWSSASGYLSGLAANPISVIKTRIQAAAHPSIAVGRQYQYKGMLDAFATIYRTEGFRGYFAGINATCARLAIGSGAQLTTFSTAKQTLLNNGICTNSQFTLAFCASAMSGVVVAVIICPFDVTTVRLYNQVKAWLLASELGDSPALMAFIASIVCAIPVVCVEGPLDVVNTRLMNQGSGTNGTLLYNGVFDCLFKIWKTEGLHGLYKGLGPLYLRIAPHTTLSLVIWDVLNNILINKSRS